MKRENDERAAATTDRHPPNHEKSADKVREILDTTEAVADKLDRMLGTSLMKHATEPDKPDKR